MTDRRKLWAAGYDTPTEDLVANLLLAVTGYWEGA